MNSLLWVQLTKEEIHQEDIAAIISFPILWKQRKQETMNVEISHFPTPGMFPSEALPYALVSIIEIPQFPFNKLPFKFKLA